jgi:hypothetical protein
MESEQFHSMLTFLLPKLKTRNRLPTSSGISCLVCSGLWLSSLVFNNSSLQRWLACGTSQDKEVMHPEK